MGLKVSKQILLLVVSMFIFEISHALNGYPGFNLGVGYGMRKGENDGDQYSTARTENVIFAAIGTTHEKGMYLGFRYEQQSLVYATNTGKQTATGVSLGFSQGGSYILAHRFWNISRDLETGSMDGKGHGFDFGYQFPFFYKNFLTMGVQYSVRYTQYDDIEGRATTLHVPILAIGGNF